MVSHFRFSSFRFALTFCALACLSIGQVSRASVIVASSLPGEIIQTACVTQDLVFVLDHRGNFHDVTSTLYTMQGCTFCVCDGETLQIFPDYNAGTVQDGDGNLIGRTIKSSDMPTSTNR